MTYDKEADAVYLYLSHEKVAYTRVLDSGAIVDYSEDDKPVGIEFLSVSSGVNTSELPGRAEIEKALKNKGIKAFA